MKFSNGNWLDAKGIHISSPAEVREVKADSKGVTISAPASRIWNRGMTLGGPLFTLRLSSPMPDVIRVQFYHYKGAVRKGPEFELAADPTGADICIEETEGAISVTSGSLTARIRRKDGWAIGFETGGKQFTGSNNRGLAYITADDGSVYMREQLSLGVSECIYGMGERFTPFVRNGQTVDIWNEDGGTSTEQSYKNIPFYISNRGYGVLVNHPEKVSFEVGSEKVEKVQFSVPGEYLDYFIINGPSMKEVLERYTALTGRPALPPPWSFGLWLTTSFTTSYDEATVNSFVDGMAEKDLPLHVFHFDCFWMKEFNWCDFKWDPEVFPDPPNMLKRLKGKGLHICVWINPYIAQRSELFDEGMENGYLLKRPNGDVWQWDMWQPGMGIVDFTNPAACRWFGDKLKALVDMGVDCFKTDFGERIPTDVAYYDGSDPEKMHNYYTYLYNKVVYEVLEEKLGSEQAVLFARSATVGSQKFPVHWGGDCWATFDSMAESLRGGLSLCLSGFGFWSHDIGGFEHTATADVYKRWTAFGLLSTHSRLHGSHSYRVPWLFDDEAVDVMRFFTKLKCSLMPYLFNAACDAADKGVPVMRAMVMEFQDDPACAYLDRQYMLGDSLLVAPVFREDGIAEYYLPKGRWTNFLTGEITDGGTWQRESHGYMSLPLFVRPNSIIAIGKEDMKPDYDYADGVAFHIFGLEDGGRASAKVNAKDGRVDLEITAQRRGSEITVAAKNPGGKPWSIVLPGLSCSCASSCRIEAGAKGSVVTPNAGVDRLTIVIG